MEEIDIYDFDKTIIPFDSGSRFCLYCFVHYPWTAFLLPIQLIGLLLAFAGIIDFTKYKKICFSFIRFIPLENAVSNFWDKYEGSVHKWFYNKKRKAVVISASPDFLLNELKDRIGIDTLICSRHNSKTGALLGENCRGEEKVRRFYEQFDKDSIRVIDVYSDSIKHDQPIFSLATGNCYHIVKSARRKFDYSRKYPD